MEEIDHLVADISEPRCDGRNFNQIRPVNFEIGYTEYADGSVLASFGKTRVLCTICITEGVPDWMKRDHVPGGWLTAEYSMLPSSTNVRKPRDSGKPDGRSIEIRRLIGRSLRAAIDLNKLPPMTLYADCDVIQADGGTRTCAITGSYVALKVAIDKLASRILLPDDLLLGAVSAVSVGMVEGRTLLDLCYSEDHNADVDMNVAMTDKGEFIEVQSTAENRTFSKAAFQSLLGLAEGGCKQLFALQKNALESNKR
ncbi:MAG: ribonuclease PH [Planctomycetes bacterium]|nr:ribonuclease PH [Planctomycetota bacterium]